MQKFLRLMNMRLDLVVNDIVGLTGTKIITAFIGGEKSGKKLAVYRHYNCRKSEVEIDKALQYNGREDYFFCPVARMGHLSTPPKTTHGNRQANKGTPRKND